jgi:hypothetical protein
MEYGRQFANDGVSTYVYEFLTLEFIALKSYVHSWNGRKPFIM